MKFLPILLILVVVGCTGSGPTGESVLALRPASEAVEAGNLAEFDYTLKLQDGTIVRSGSDEVTAGTGQMILNYPLDSLIIGMKPGEFKKITLPPERAFGEYNPDKIMRLPFTQLIESGVIPVEGMTININARDGIVQELDGDTVVIDFNSQNAGETLVFDLIVTNIQ